MYSADKRVDFAHAPGGGRIASPYFFPISITRGLSGGGCESWYLNRNTVAAMPFPSATLGCRLKRHHSHQPRRAASILAMSILSMSIIAAKTRLASAPPAAIASVNTRGVICQEIPQRSLHQPHHFASPPLVIIAFQYRSVSS